MFMEFDEKIPLFHPLENQISTPIISIEFSIEIIFYSLTSLHLTKCTLSNRFHKKAKYHATSFAHHTLEFCRVGVRLKLF